jgi:hypothetical protein
MNARKVLVAIVFLLALALVGLVPLRGQDQAQTEQGWKWLFDGKSPTHWRGFKQPGFPAKVWTVEDNCLHVLPKGGGGDLVSVAIFDNFEFSWEWRISPGGNSGVKILINEEYGPIGPEYQMLDEVNNEEGKKGSKWSTAALYDVLGASNVVVRPLSEFNQSRILVQGRHVEHWLNGKLVLSYELESNLLKTAIATSKFKGMKFYGIKRPGRILLQEHGSEVWFRLLKIRELPEP